MNTYLDPTVLESNETNARTTAIATRDSYAAMADGARNIIQSTEALLQTSGQIRLWFGNSKMSEYWISPPHFGTMGAKNTTAVHTPRNIDLPAHVVLQEPETGLQKQQKKRKYLCLSFWLMGLALLTTGAIIVAMFLVPETDLRDRNTDFLQAQTCLDLLPLEDKVKHAELVLVGSVMPDMTLNLDKVIKGELKVHQDVTMKISEAGKSCFEASPRRQVFFLVSERQGRSVTRASASQTSMNSILMPKFQALEASDKVVEIIENLAILNAQQTLNIQAQKEVETTTEGKMVFNFLSPVSCIYAWY